MASPPGSTSYIVEPEFITGVSAGATPSQPGDYSITKASIGGVYPENAVAAHPFSRIETLITPEQLRERFLFGIPLYSTQKDPVTGKRAHMGDELIKDFILRSVTITETLTGADIFPVQRNEKFAFDKALYESFGFFITRHKPIISMEELAIVPSNQDVVYVVPLAWIEAANFPRGQVNIIPLTAAFQGSGFLPPSQAAGGAAFLEILGAKTWIPAYWQCNYTTGFPDGNVPRHINEIIGTVAAIEILRALEATNKIPSYSLGIDGVSQSISTGGSSVYDNIIQQLEIKKDSLVQKVKAAYGFKLFSSNI